MGYTYKASAAGVFYFACKVTGHCKFTKQKLALTVTPAAGKGKVEETSVTSCTGKGKKRVCKTIVTRRLPPAKEKTRNAWKSNPLPVKQRKSLPPKQQPKKAF